MLAVVGARRDGRVDSEQLKHVIDRVGELPAKRVAGAGREIVAAAQLWPFWTSPSFIRRFFPRSDLQVLEKKPSFAWLFLFHPDGYVREAALNAIHHPPSSPFFLTAIALRLNDWAEPVRAAASRCAAHVFPGVDAAIAADAAPFLLTRYLLWGRWGDGEMAILDSLFGRADVTAQLSERFASGTAGPLATCLGLASRYAAIDIHLPMLASTAAQPAVRATALRCLVEQKASWQVGSRWHWVDKVYGEKKRIPVHQERAIAVTLPLESWIRAGIADRSAMVRRCAADALIANRSVIRSADELVELLSKDVNSSVRERADFLRRHRHS